MRRARHSFLHYRRPDKEDLAVIAFWLRGRFARGGADNTAPSGEAAENAAPNGEAADNPTAEVADHEEPAPGQRDDESHSSSTATTTSPPRTSGAFGINGMGDDALAYDNSGYEGDADPNTSPMLAEPSTSPVVPQPMSDPVVTATVPEVEEGHTERDKKAKSSPQAAPRYVPLSNLFLSSVTSSLGSTMTYQCRWFRRLPPWDLASRQVPLLLRQLRPAWPRIGPRHQHPTLCRVTEVYESHQAWRSSAPKSGLRCGFIPVHESLPLFAKFVPPMDLDMACHAATEKWTAGRPPLTS